MKTSQEEFVIKQLNKNGFISRNFALDNYISRLGAIICDLKKIGFEFEPKYVKGKKGKNYVYYMTKNPYKKVVYSVPELGKEITLFTK